VTSLNARFKRHPLIAIGMLLSLLSPILPNTGFADELSGDLIATDDSKPAGNSTRFTTLFGGDSRWLVPAKNFKKWHDMTARAAHLGPPSESAWTSMMSHLPYASRDEKIHGVQELINSVEYERDKTTWGTDDYWASPSELFHQGRGDSEDIAIAKYFALRGLGFAAEDLRILIAEFDNYLPDAVLLVAVPGDILQLTWLTDNVNSFERRKDHVELYSLNEDYLWIHNHRAEITDLNLDGKIMEDSAVDKDSQGRNSIQVP
jgi:predicted transglutaminase-like cysteine proteinase